MRTLLALIASLGLVGSALLLAAPVLGQHSDADGPATEPSLLEADPGCGDGYVQIRFVGEEITTGNDKSFEIEGRTGNIEITWTDGFSFNYDADDAEVPHVYVSSEFGTHHYDFTSFMGGGVMHDDGLVPPSEGEDPAEITQITFCHIPQIEEESPTPTATATPTPEPTEEPTPEPTEEPTPEPTSDVGGETPTPEPTEEPTPEPTEEPTPEPTEEPTPEPTMTAAPTVRESELPGNPTPTPAGDVLPDTAAAPISPTPATVLGLLMLGSLTTLVYVRAARRR